MASMTQVRVVADVLYAIMIHVVIIYCTGICSRRIMHISGLHVLQSGDIEMKKNPLSTGENEN